MNFRPPFRRILATLAPGAVLLVSWELTAWLIPSGEFYFGSPSGILHEAGRTIRDGSLVIGFGVTLIEALLGFLAGTALGTCLGFLFFANTSLYRISRPYLIALGALPVFAIGPALIFWFGTGIFSKIVLGILATFAIAVNQAYLGAANTDPSYIRLAQSGGGSNRQVLFTVVFPSAMLSVIEGSRYCVGMSLMAAFVGEFISSRAGLGNLIMEAEGQFNMNGVWLGIFAIMVLASLLHLATVFLESRALAIVQRCYVLLERLFPRLSR